MPSTPARVMPARVMSGRGGRPRRARRTAPILCVLALALQTVLLYMPASGESGLPPGVDKIGHASMFGGVTILALAAGWEWLPVLLVTYAPLSELIQGLPAVRRDPDWHDVVADVTGIILALAVHRFVTRRSSR